MPKSKFADMVNKRYLPTSYVEGQVEKLKQVIINKIDWLIKRKVGGMRQADLAKKINMCQSALSNKLNGKSDFTLDELIKISLVFNIPLVELVSDV